MSDAEVPRVSIVVASYDSAAYLAAAVASALAQTERRIEIVIADDASTDDSPAIARRLAEADPRVWFLPSAVNGGPGAARNRAIAAARGEWIAILDADDLFEPERVAVLLVAAERHDADLVADDLLVFADDGRAPRRFLDAEDARTAGEITPARYMDQTILLGRKPNLGYLKPMIRRRALLDLGIRYDETLRIGEDDELVVRLLAAGCRYRLEPRPLYRYRKHARSVSHRLTVAELDGMAAAVATMRSWFTDAAVLRGLARRAAAVDVALDFQRIVDALKGRRFVAAAMLAVRRPRAVALLRQPIAARFTRSRARRRRR